MNKLKFSVYGVTGQIGTNAPEKSTKVEPLVYGSGTFEDAEKLTNQDIIECQNMAEENRILLPIHLNINIGNTGKKQGQNKGVEPLLPMI